MCRGRHGDVGGAFRGVSGGVFVLLLWVSGFRSLDEGLCIRHSGFRGFFRCVGPRLGSVVDMVLS